MSAQTKEARRHQRFNINVEANVQVKDGRRVTARTRDVSRSGICLIAAEPVDRAETLNVELVLNFGNNAFSEPLRLKAHVVWCTPIANAFQVGVMFDALSDEQDTYLEMFLHFLDGTMAPQGVDGEGDGAVPQEIDGDEETGPATPEDKDDPFRP